jgi:hypothetical protein
MIGNRRFMIKMSDDTLIISDRSNFVLLLKIILYTRQISVDIKPTNKPVIIAW